MFLGGFAMFLGGFEMFWGDIEMDQLHKMGKKKL